MRIKRFTEDAILPTRTHPTDAGLDFYAPEDVVITAGGRVKINTHVGVALPEGTVGLILDRSSMGSIGVKTFGGVIDQNYRGEIQIVLGQISRSLEPDGSYTIASYDPVHIMRGDKIAQMIIVPVFTPELEEVSEFETTDRNDNGFGSSGR